MTDIDAIKQKFQTMLVADLLLRGQEENEAAKAVYNEVLDVLWPQVEELIAQILEYEHALEHVIQPDHHDGQPCQDCQHLSKSALDGINRKDFLEIVQDI